ncbi:hypothetical protein RclHR1_00460015 [Rhizophagus clarus]|uniref:Hsp70 family protein n=1 Tax=Rhizophagus clarus TaxID=94130 RepID=A0A2Z6SC01_9GLOM|nr:hypothetical protein RclHR1_00460015 [Rhizophagus clarus]GES73214.1 hypothetical protein GLOIN_2v1662554 [Rhizophagus clarus]
MNDYYCIVGINFRDFGITYAGFAYSYMNPNDIHINIEWEGGPLSNEASITDYLRRLGKVIEYTMYSEQQADFHTEVLFILTVPDKYTISTWTIRECAFKAGLLRDLYSQNLKFITESEAIATFCVKYLKIYNLSVGQNFMVIDCGGDTVSSTTRQLLENERLSLITERIGNDCGSSSVDQEFLKFLERKVGSSAINLVKENRPCQLQYMLQIFFRLYKINFTGIQSEFNTIKFDLKAHQSALAQYCNEEHHDKIEEAEWCFELKFDDVKRIFDPVIERIIQLIDSQLRLCNDNCFALLLTGEFGKSKYLQLRIKNEFRSRVRIISRPPYSVTAIIRGAVLYGLNHVDLVNQDQPTNIIKELKEVKEENKVFQDQILMYNNVHVALVNKYNYETDKHLIVIEKLRNDIKEIEEKYQTIVEKLKNDIDGMEEKWQNKINDIDQQYRNNVKLQKYDDLQEKYNKEINQNQIIVEKLKNDIKEIEWKYQNQISDIDQQYQHKIKLQEQRINQLQQSLELKENKLQNSEKEKEVLNVEFDNLYQKNTNLMNQLVNILQRNTFSKDDISNYQSENIVQNSVISLNNDISDLNDNLKNYIADLNQDVIVNMEEIKKLLLLYKCPIKISNQKDDQLLIQAVLQRHIIETILSYATKYFGQSYHLESDIKKLRYHIYTILNNHGFADIYRDNGATYKHPFITYYKEKLNKTMNEFRIIKGREKIISENLAETIICEVIKIFWFKLKIHNESVVQYVWIPYNAKVNEIFMKRSNFNDNDNESLYVDLCYFPLIGKDLTSNNQKVCALAKVLVRRNQHQIQQN